MAIIRQALVGFAVLACLLSFIIAALPNLMFPVTSAKAPLTRGQNSTVLFLALSEPGQINVQLSAAQALIRNHSDIKIHVASFPGVKDRVRRVGRDITFHPIPGLPRQQAAMRGIPGCDIGSSPTCMSHEAGRAGVESLRAGLEMFLWAWTGEEHLALHDRMVDIIHQADPAVIVVDWAFRPAVDAIRTTGRQYMLLTPLAVADILAPRQPYAAVFWKYPAWGTGFSFPVPWKDRWENAYVDVRTLSGVLFRPNTKNTIAFLAERGINSADISGIRNDVLFVTQTPAEVSLPLDVGHPNLINAGPMLVDTGSAQQQDAELAAWIGNSPTVVVNLGSLFQYDETKANIMVLALAKVLKESNVQILWKFGQKDDLAVGILAPLDEFISARRIRIAEWISIDTLPLLNLDTVILSVNQGGASSCYEAFTAGVPQVVVPQWHDLYNFAQLVEDRGLGIRAIRDSAPDFTVDGIVGPMLRLIQESEESNKVRQEATRIGKVMKADPGGDVAAAVIAKVANGERWGPQHDLQLQDCHGIYRHFKRLHTVY